MMNKMLSFAGKWIEQEIIMLSEKASSTKMSIAWFLSFEEARR
jgi:hypothetical protein